MTTKRFLHDASLHPATVSALSRRDDRRPVWQRTRAARPPTPEVETTQINPAVWRAAMQLAGGDASRLEIISTSEVRVRNTR